MIENDEYIQFPLEFQGHPYHGVEYFFTVFSNKKRLRFNIDSGALTNLISDVSLNECCYIETGQSVKSQGLLGGVKTKIILLDFVPEGKDFETADKTIKFSLPFTVLRKKDNKLFSEDEYDGLLGGTFLQFCDVNFREGYIRIYKDKANGFVMRTLLKRIKEEAEKDDTAE